MRKNTVKRAFTLVEVVIVLIVAALLITVLFSVYRTTADVALRIKYQKQLGV
jgi:prepilin-type N-terminal cleavage/methylation domain-containing protein